MAFNNWRKQNPNIEPNLSAAHLSEANLRGADLIGADLRGADLRRADLCRADLGKADLTNADLRNANFAEAGLCEADLSQADLRGANLRGEDLRGINLSYTDLREVDHNQWVAQHGTDKCMWEQESSLENENGVSNDPVSKTRTVQSQKRERSSLENENEPFSKTRHSLVTPCSVKENSVKASSVEGARLASNFLTSGQKGSGVATPSNGASLENENGDHSLPTLAELFQKLTLPNQKLWYRRTDGDAGLEGIRVAAEILATQGEQQ